VKMMSMTSGAPGPSSEVVPGDGERPFDALGLVRP
jgi:hypothetical protein